MASPSRGTNPSGSSSFRKTLSPSVFRHSNFIFLQRILPSFSSVFGDSVIREFDPTLRDFIYVSSDSRSVEALCPARTSASSKKGFCSILREESTQRSNSLLCSSVFCDSRKGAENLRVSFLISVMIWRIKPITSRRSSENTGNHYSNGLRTELSESNRSRKIRVSIFLSKSDESERPEENQ